MYLVTMTALRPLCGDYGKPDTGDNFTTDNITAESLEMRGLARRYQPTYVSPPPVPAAWTVREKMYTPTENKMIYTDENKGQLQPAPQSVDNPQAVRRRGRPPGSKNKPRT